MDGVRVEPRSGGLNAIVVDTPLAEAELYLHGAHLTRWTPAGQRPVLFTSARSFFEAGKPIRGGVPVVFPWFGPRGGGLPGPMHGYARTAEWTLESSSLRADGAVELRLALPPVDDLRLAFHVAIGTRLEMELEVRNAGGAEATFEEALHTYFAVGDIRQVTLTGLEGTEYLDKADQFLRKRVLAAPMRIERYTDQVHVNTDAACVIADAAWSRRIVIEKSGSNTTVVWNPWADKTPGFADMDPAEWPGMLCVETANAGENAVRLAAGGTHRMRAAIRVE